MDPPRSRLIRRPARSFGRPARRGGGASEKNLRHSERAVKEYVLTEHAFAIGGAPQFGMTKEEAVEQRGALTRDCDILERYLAGDHNATVKMKPLLAAAHRQASP